MKAGKAAVLIGGDKRAVFFLYGWLFGANVEKARGVHAGAVAVALWACKVEPEVLASAAPLNMSFVQWLDAVLPANAHTLCTGKITIATSMLGWTTRGPLVKFQRWDTRDQLLGTLQAACTQHPLFNYRTGYCSAAGAPDTHKICANATITESRARPALSIRNIQTRPDSVQQWVHDGKNAGATWRN